MPLPIIIILAVIESISIFVGLPCFLFCEKHNLVPDRYFKNRRKLWKALAIASCFLFIGWGYIPPFIRYLKERK